MKSVCIEIGDLEYELEVTHYEAGSAPSGWDPGAGWEVELDDTVKVWGLDFKVTGPGSGNAVPAVIDKIHLKTFIKIYADYNSLPLDKAEQKLLEEVYENVTQQYADDFDDREPDDER
jgi:hypothetical protein